MRKIKMSFSLKAETREYLKRIGRGNMTRGIEIMIHRHELLTQAQELRGWTVEELDIIYCAGKNIGEAGTIFGFNEVLAEQVRVYAEGDADLVFYCGIISAKIKEMSSLNSYMLLNKARDEYEGY